MKAGTQLAGRYRLENLLGRGGMGEVWRGVDQNLRRPVAIKLLLPNLLTDERRAQRALSRFRREGEAAARLNHPNIAAIYDLDEHWADRGDGEKIPYPFLVLEYLDGRNLDTLLEASGARGLPIEAVLHYGTQASDALAVAHARGVVHRDIKPSNLVLLGDGTLKVCDFGIARLKGATTGLSVEGAFIGTLAYAPPEQLIGQRVDHRADLYALGATLYHLLTGRHVFPTGDPTALAYMHATQAPAPPSAHRSGIPSDIDSLVVKLLAKDPQLRSVTAEEIATSFRVGLSRTNAGREYLASASPLEQEVLRMRVVVEREIIQMRNTAKRQAGEILDVARAEANEIRAKAQSLLEEAKSTQRTRALPEFEVVLRGYDRHQVDDYIGQFILSGVSPPLKAPSFEVVLRGYDRDQVDKFFEASGHPLPNLPT